MTPVQGEGVYCTVFAHELEAKTKEGWQLVGVIETENTTQTSDIEVAPSNQNSYGQQTATTLRGHVVKTPLFLLRRSAESELGRLGQELEKTKLDLEAAKTALKTAHTSLLKAEQQTKEDGAVIGDLRQLVSGLEANRDQLSLALKRATEEYNALQKRLGKQGKPTSFERLLTEEDETPSEIQDPLV